MTPDDLDRLEALAAAATPGPWRERDRYVCAPSGHAITDVRYKNGAADAAYIAALDPAMVQRLIAAARLGAAWQAAEAALPEGWRLHLLEATVTNEWRAVAGKRHDDGEDPFIAIREAATPAAALLSLAEALRGRT